MEALKYVTNMKECVTKACVVVVEGWWDGTDPRTPNLTPQQVTVINDKILNPAINAAAKWGAIIFLAAGNSNVSKSCDSLSHLAQSLPTVISVSSSTSRDTKAAGNPTLAQTAAGGTSAKGAAIGDCIDLLAPSWHKDGCTDTSTCTLGITTTDTSGNVG